MCRTQARSCACRLFRYEDGFYAHYPLRISPADPSATSTFGNGIRFEFGGMMRWAAHLTPTHATVWKPALARLWIS